MTATDDKWFSVQIFFLASFPQSLFRCLHIISCFSSLRLYVNNFYNTTKAAALFITSESPTSQQKLLKFIQNSEFVTGVCKCINVCFFFIAISSQDRQSTC